MGSLNLPYSYFAWLLLGIPLLLLIHCLRVKRKKQVISTFFLVEKMTFHSQRGAGWKRLISRVPLWMQTLMILVMVLLAMGLQGSVETSKMSLALVVDRSASMSAFRKELLDKVEKLAQDLASQTSKLEFQLFSSRWEDGEYYRGESIDELMLALENMPLDQGHHDLWENISRIQQRLRAQASAHGAIEAQGLLLVTDHMPRDDLDIPWLSVGESIDNVGIVGYSPIREAMTNKGDTQWQILLSNHSPLTQRRVLNLNGEKLTDLSFAAQQMITYKGTWPVDADGLPEASIKLSLSADAHSLDDEIQLCRPRTPELRVKVDDSIKKTMFLESLKLVYPVLKWNGKRSELCDMFISADLDMSDDTLVQEGHKTTISPFGIRVHFYGAVVDKAFSPLDILPSEHPWVRSLPWAELAGHLNAVGEASLEVHDEVLLWGGDIPLIFRRHHVSGDVGESWHFNVSMESKIWRTAAMRLFLHRCLSELSAKLTSPRRENLPLPNVLSLSLESLSPLSLIWGDGTEETLHPSSHKVSLPLDGSKRQLKVLQDGREIYMGAFQFVDPRESDFENAISAKSEMSVWGHAIDYDSGNITEKRRDERLGKVGQKALGLEGRGFGHEAGKSRYLLLLLSLCALCMVVDWHYRRSRL
jgi:hypothetical protein